jgi:hypothetical protein
MLPFDAIKTIKFKLKLRELTGENKRLHEELNKIEPKTETVVQEVPPKIDEISANENQ